MTRAVWLSRARRPLSLPPHRPWPFLLPSGKCFEITTLHLYNKLYFRSKEVNANDPVEFSPRADLHVKNVTLGAELADEKGRSTLKLIYLGPPVASESDEEGVEDEEGSPEPSETVLCSLTPGKVGGQLTRHATLTQIFVSD